MIKRLHCIEIYCDNCGAAVESHGENTHFQILDHAREVNENIAARVPAAAWLISENDEILCSACRTRKRSPWDLLGCHPDFTGGLTTEEFMNEARGRGMGT